MTTQIIIDFTLVLFNTQCLIFLLIYLAPSFERYDSVISQKFLFMMKSSSKPNHLELSDIHILVYFPNKNTLTQKINKY